MSTNTSIGPDADRGGNDNPGNADGCGNKTLGDQATQQPPTGAELKSWSDEAGWDVLLNKAGTTFRKLPDEDKVGLDATKAIDLMAAHPSLIKRPVVTGTKTLLVGFKPDQWSTTLG